MRILLFNHHPDCLHYMYKGLKLLGHDVEIAPENVTAWLFGSSSVKNYKFQFADQIIEPENFSKEFNDIKWNDDLNHDLYISIKPAVLSIFREKGLFDCRLQGEIGIGSKYSKGIKVSNHQDAPKFGYQFVSNWVPQKELVKEKKYITQLITLKHLSSETQELERLRNNGYNVEIGSSEKFILDYDILPHTSLLVHNKKTGINCYAVCKALDMGIPVYMEKYTKKLIGFGDLPDNLFLFKDEMNIEEAYKKSLNINNKDIQDAFRSIYSLDRLKTSIEKVLNNDL